MKTLKNEEGQNAPLNPKLKKVSKKVKIILNSLTTETALNEPVQDTKIELPVYKLVGGMMGLRRAVRIPNASPQQLVLSNEVHEELLIRGIRMKYTWDEVARAILQDHILNNRSSDHLFQ